MTHLYDIIIEGQPVHTLLTEDTFFEVMADLSTAWYEKGFPDPSTLSHVMYPQH